ncbi:hypothetical protein [Streptomyces sp. Rer75]|uniref:hypothetical protein n=1 Tax=unclassified Streptomyces TaxID=2593676 RepID=UPI00211DFF1A|nr:hypothetical protein [Streptomyces sp. Rer75]
MRGTSSAHATGHRGDNARCGREHGSAADSRPVAWRTVTVLGSTVGTVGVVCRTVCVVRRLAHTVIPSVGHAI